MNSIELTFFLNSNQLFLLMNQIEVSRQIYWFKFREWITFKSITLNFAELTLNMFFYSCLANKAEFHSTLQTLHSVIFRGILGGILFNILELGLIHINSGAPPNWCKCSWASFYLQTIPCRSIVFHWNQFNWIKKKHMKKTFFCDYTHPN